MLLSLNGKTYIENGSIIKFSTNTLLTEDLITIKYTRYLVLHIFTSSIDFSDKGQHGTCIIVLDFAF